MNPGKNNADDINSDSGTNGDGRGAGHGDHGVRSAPQLSSAQSGDTGYLERTAGRGHLELSDAVNKAQEIARQTLPPTVTTSFQGTANVFQSSIKGFLFLTIIAILFVYLILGILYESYIHRLTILCGLPSAVLGVLVTLLLFGIDLNVLSFVGLIMLISIVKKNAIMQIDFALEAQR